MDSLASKILAAFLEDCPSDGSDKELILRRAWARARIEMLTNQIKPEEQFVRNVYRMMRDSYRDNVRISMKDLGYVIDFACAHHISLGASDAT